MNVDNLHYKPENKVNSNLSELVKLTNGKIDIGLKRKRVDFEWNLDDAIGLLKKSNETRKSEFFCCNNLAWSVEVCKKFCEGKQYLTLGLRAAHFAEPAASWSTTVAFKITLVNRWKDFKNRSISGVKTEFMHHIPYWGRDKFIEIDQITFDYLQNNQLKFLVHLECKKSEPEARDLVGSLRFNLCLQGIFALLLIILFKWW